MQGTSSCPIKMLNLIKLNHDKHLIILFFSNSFKGIQMLTLLVPILISFLLEGNQLRSATKFTIQLHEQSLQWLMKIGPKYPQVIMVLGGLGLGVIH